MVIFISIGRCEINRICKIMKIKELPRFDTPLPGQIMTGMEAEKIIKGFLHRFRKVDSARVPSNLPTACILQGRKLKDISNIPNLLRKPRIFFYLDPAPCFLYLTEPESVLNYLAKRQPWEDYDICLFDESLEWCIGITHNDDIIVSDTKGVLK